MTYQEALDYIESTSCYGSVLGLSNIEEMLNRLLNPQNKLKFVHIAGTNGKGSVLAFVSTVLTKAGYRVGRYISPVLWDYRERIQINEKYIAKADLGRYMERMKEVCEQMVAEGYAHPTPFEIETALAFCYFADKQCDIVVLETGLGGSLDATNVIENTVVSVLTSISMDHMAFLGETLEEIAENKAGIIKNGRYVIAAKQAEEVISVIEKVANDRNAKFKIVDVANAKNRYNSLRKQSFSYKGYSKLEIPLLGMHQIENAIVAIETIEALKEKGFAIEEKSIREGFLETKWEGRFSILAEKPYILMDGAHNEDAAKKLADSIVTYFSNKKIIYIMGVLKDKEYEKIIAHTHAYASQIITITPPNNPRALHAYDLAQAVRLYQTNVTAADSIAEAMEMACLLADKDSVIIAFGSLSYLKEFTEIVADRKNLKFTL